MPDVQSERDQYLAAQAHTRSVKGFQIHLIVYLAVNAGLILINALSGGHWWVQWPLIGWGIGILGHAYLVYRSGPRNVATSKTGAS
jgi:hypothetical protein